MTDTAGASTPPLPGATKDDQSVTADWVVLQEPIEGVRAIEVRNVLRDTGHLTEVFRQDWFGEPVAVDQVFQITLGPNAVSGWHVHLNTTDRLFVVSGQIKIALFDGRDGSETPGRVNEFRFGDRRPGLVIVPPGVWHGIRNLTSAESRLLNLVDTAYAYADPDHWRLPPDTAEIPHRL